MRNRIRLLALLCAVLLTGCAAQKEQAAEQTAVPMQQAVEQLQQQFTQQAQAFQNTQQFGGQAAQFTANPTPGAAPEAEQSTRRATPGSNAFVPATAGLLIGSEVVKNLISQ